MGILDAILKAITGHLVQPPDHDQERAEVESSVADFAHQRADADTKIAGWRKQTEVALKEYPRERSRPDLAETLLEARRQVGRPLPKGEDG